MMFHLQKITDFRQNGKTYSVLMNILGFEMSLEEVDGLIQVVWRYK